MLGREAAGQPHAPQTSICEGHGMASGNAPQTSFTGCKLSEELLRVEPRRRSAAVYLGTSLRYRSYALQMLNARMGELLVLRLISALLLFSASATAFAQIIPSMKTLRTAIVVPEGTNMSYCGIGVHSIFQVSESRGEGLVPYMSSVTLTLHASPDGNRAIWVLGAAIERFVGGTEDTDPKRVPLNLTEITVSTNDFATIARPSKIVPVSERQRGGSLLSHEAEEIYSHLLIGKPVIFSFSGREDHEDTYLVRAGGQLSNDDMQAVTGCVARIVERRAENQGFSK